MSVDKSLLISSYHVEVKVAKSKKPHIIADELSKSCVLEMSTTILEIVAKKELELVPLSNDVIQSRIDYLSFTAIETGKQMTKNHSWRIVSATVPIATHDGIGHLNDSNANPRHPFLSLYVIFVTY